MRHRRGLKRRGHTRGWGVIADYAVEAESREARELAEMEDILHRHGFNRHEARALQVEGMGPEELRSRARHAPGAVGSLEYTHRLYRRAR